MMKICENLFETTCRLCLSHGNTENMVCLTESTAEDDGLSCYGTYGKAVSNLTGISIRNDLPALALPEKMCDKCFYDLKQATIFKRRCESSNDLLIKFVHNHLSCTTGRSLAERTQPT
ncbi:zinc-finger associated domain (zf-AD) domain-containing protein [Phthorimaea operculella]|nr:zinc-finger associated domain (zf-AD) domain-containing protein [Phthorimaea operculella]